MLLSFQCVILLVSCVTFSITHTDLISGNISKLYDGYPDIDILKSTAVFISNTFRNLERSNSTEGRKFYGKQLADALMETTDVMKTALNYHKEIVENTMDMMLEISSQVGRFCNSGYGEKFGEMNEHVQQFSCSNDDQSMQYILMDAYDSLVNIKLKSFLIDIFFHYNTYGYNSNFNDAQLYDGIRPRLKQVIRTMTKYNSIVKRMMSATDKIIKSCDPIKFVRDGNFIELERVFQLVVAPARLMTNNKCSGTCASVSNFTWNENLKPRGLADHCKGITRSCKKGPNIAYCSAKNGDSRRYNWIIPSKYLLPNSFAGRDMKTWNDEKYEDFNNCPVVNLKIVNSETSFLSGGDKCEICICTCEENTHLSDRNTFIISARMAKADVNNSMAVVGVKFVKKNGIIYTQIRQGRVTRGGWIDQNTVHWKPIELLNHDRINFYLSYQIPHEDFIVISQDVRFINLDDLYCPMEKGILIGIGLKQIKTGENINHVRLDILCQNFEFSTGSSSMSSSLSQPKYLSKNRLQKKIGSLPPDKASRIRNGNKWNFQKDLYIAINISDWKVDSGQSVIPWFDAQNVTRTPSLLLNGVGLYHRGEFYDEGDPISGGFLAYRLFLFDHSVLL